MPDDLPTLLATKFIARRDAKAIQLADGRYNLHTADGHREGARLPWKMGDIRAHLARERTYGHYLLDPEGHCKLFAFDIDLEKSGTVAVDADWTDFQPVPDLRASWLDRRWPGRSWIKFQFRSLAHKLAGAVHHELGIPCAVAYSGGKGVHVYGFTGLKNASDVRDGAEIALDLVGGFTPHRGEHVYKATDQDPETGFPNFTIEIFPKQRGLEGKDLGNLMRLPLGRNMKSPKDPTFFIDMRAPLGEFIQRDPTEALTYANPWR